MAKLSPIGELWLKKALEAGWGRTWYALREGSVSCPKCEVLHGAQPGLERCHSCGWLAKSAVEGEL